jgi:hypothetical protein
MQTTMRSRRGPDGAHPSVALLLAHLMIDELGSAAQGQLAQRGEIALLKKDSTARCAFSGSTPCLPFRRSSSASRRQIDEFDLVGALEHASGTVSRT